MNNNVVHTLLPFAPLVARVLVGGMFLMGGIQKITGFAGMVLFAQSAGLPSPELAITIAIVVEILGGLSVILGYRIFWGALALGIFTIAASFIFHTNFADQVQQMFFIKNMGIVAALLYMVRFGAGQFSIEK
ncbi:DoxX family protein [Candidatus Kaiserbacteria bacterium]|nr:DoxX family protein [Candidatus Kaiserbacteria bacterium]